MRYKIGQRPYELIKKDGMYIIKFYPMMESAKNTDKVLFSLTVSKKEFDELSAKIK